MCDLLLSRRHHPTLQHQINQKAKLGVFRSGGKLSVAWRGGTKFRVKSADSTGSSSHLSKKENDVLVALSATRGKKKKRAADFNLN